MGDFFQICVASSEHMNFTKRKSSMTPLVSNRVHFLQEGGIYQRVNPGHLFFFKVTYGFLVLILENQVVPNFLQKIVRFWLFWHRLRNRK